MKKIILQDENNFHNDTDDPIQSINDAYYERLKKYKKYSDIQIDVEKNNFDQILNIVKKL